MAIAMERGVSRFAATFTHPMITSTPCTTTGALFVKSGAAATTQTDSLMSDADQCAAFRSWKESYFTKGISEDRRAEVERYADQFEQLLNKAAAGGAEQKPEEFLRSLSSSEREVLQHMHGLVGAINPAGLSHEGAVNLLRSPGSAQDIDHDGFQMVGIAKTWTFPPPDAPEAVKQAWADTTRGLSESDVMLLQGTFLPISVPGYESPSAYLGADTDYGKFIRQTLESVQYSRRYDEPWQVETRNRQIELINDLLGRLSTN